VTKERLLAILAKALVIALILFLLWELGSIYAHIWSIDNNLTKAENDLSSIETQVAPGGPIDQSLDRIDEMLGTPTPIPVP